MTVLILAPERDVTADRTVAALNRRGVPIMRVDTAWFPQRAEFTAEFRRGRWRGALTAAGRSVALERVHSVLYRNPPAFGFPAAMSATERRWATTEAKLGVGGVLAALPVRWVNHPNRSADAAYKPRQLATAARCGLDVPDTLITNTAAAVRRFAAGGDTVAKALGAPAIVEDGGRKTTFTHRLTCADLADLRGVEQTAHQFQRWVPKAREARVIVVGDRVFAAAIHAGSAASHIDWRADYPALRYEPIDVPTPVVAGLRGYCAASGLAYGAFDFVIRPDGGWVFLECNPGGQYGWIEDAIDAPVTETIVDLLCEGMRMNTPTNTSSAAGWQMRALRLADRLADDGVLDDPAWRAAVKAVPRHAFVPRIHVQRPDGEWSETTAKSAGWLDAVYEDAPLVTALAETANGARVTVSSSTKPSLMLRMLAVLDVHEGHRVLEIGTGTGYNAALLSHRLGDENVFSVDIGAELVDSARERLAELGHTPTLVTVDGGNGLPEHAPYDRIIATCSVPAVPWAWAEQVHVGGLVLVDVKRSTHAGNLVLLRREEDRLEGRFLPRWATFMSIRHADAAPPAAAMVRVQPESGTHSTTRLDPHPWAAVVPWLLASARLPDNVGFGYRGGNDSGAPEWVTFTGDDGSWCAVQAQEDGEREVRQGGPMAIWAAFEAMHGEWEALGRPGWDRLGLTVTPDGRHRVWLDRPDGGHAWDLPTT